MTTPWTTTTASAWEWIQTTVRAPSWSEVGWFLVGVVANRARDWVYRRIGETITTVWERERRRRFLRQHGVLTLH